MMRGKPARKIVFFVLGAAAVLCVVGLGLFFLISNICRTNLRNNIISECPFSIAEDADWKIYSNNNQAGLIAQVSDHYGQANRMILVIDKSAAHYSSASVKKSLKGSYVKNVKVKKSKVKKFKKYFKKNPGRSVTLKSMDINNTLKKS